MVTTALPWRCLCGHHRLFHWWNTEADPSGTSPETVFEACVDSSEDCPCKQFTPHQPDGKV